MKKDPHRRQQQLLILTGAFVSAVTAVVMLPLITPQSIPVTSDTSLKGRVDTAMANVAYNVVEANLAVGRMNINQPNKDDCGSLVKANALVRANVDFVRSNNPTLLKQNEIEPFEALDTTQLLEDITNNPQALRLVAEESCRSLKLN